MSWGIIDGLLVPCGSWSITSHFCRRLRRPGGFASGVGELAGVAVAAAVAVGLSVGAFLGTADAVGAGAFVWAGGGRGRSFRSRCRIGAARQGHQDDQGCRQEYSLHSEVLLVGHPGHATGAKSSLAVAATNIGEWDQSAQSI